MDYNSIYSLAKDILIRLGNVYEYTGVLPSEDYSKMSYTFDNLTISSYSVYSGIIYVHYNGNPVFNSRDGIIRPGSWECLLLEIYNHIDELEAQKKSILSNKKEGYKYFQKIYEHLPKPGAQWKATTTYAARTIKNIARLRTKLSEYDASNGCGYDTFYTYEVWIYDEMSDDVICVLSVSKKDDYSPKYDECTVNKFVPGEWQEKLLCFFRNENLIKEKERLNAENESVEKSIRKLRKE